MVAASQVASCELLEGRIPQQAIGNHPAVEGLFGETRIVTYIGIEGKGRGVYNIYNRNT